MIPTKEQRERLEVLESRLIQWLKSQPMSELLDTGTVEFFLGHLDAPDRCRALTLIHRAVDPCSGRIDWRRLTDGEKDEMAEWLGIERGR